MFVVIIFCCVVLVLCMFGIVLFVWVQGVLVIYNVGVMVMGVLFMFLDVKMNFIQGMMVDIVMVVGKVGGFNVNVQQMVFLVLILLFMFNKIDIILVVMFKMLVCVQVVDFFDLVYLYGEGLIVKVDDVKNYVMFDDLKGEVVGVQVGMVFFDMFNKKGIFKEVCSYDLVVDMMCDLVLGCIKVGLGDQLIIVYQI